MSIRTDLAKRLHDGRKIARAAHKEKDLAKLGNLRAGNSGIMTADGDVAGSCHRLAHLRALGIETEEPDDSRIIMFQMGTANEDVVYNDLIKTKAPDEVILREEEIPIEWFTKNGTKVTGRPDMVVCRLDYGPDKFLIPVDSGIDPSNIASGPGLIVYKGELPNRLQPKTIPVYGIELKGVFSVWTSREVLFDGSPKMANLVQAAHYSWRLGVPFRLLYKQYANQAIPAWAQKFFPKSGAKHSEHVEYNDKGEVKNIKPFEICYELEFQKDGYLQYRREGEGRWTKTMVRDQDIERYYEFISKMAESKDVGPRPMTVDAKGKEKSFSNCNYCVLKETCVKSEKKGYDEWFRQVREALKK